MGEGQTPTTVLDTEQTGPLPPVLLRALATKDPAHSHLDWTIRQREGSTVLILRWEKEVPQRKKAKKAKATKKRIGPAVPVGPITALPKPVTTKKDKVTETAATRVHKVTQQPTALFRATNQSGKCERELPVHTTAEVPVAAAVAGPKRRRKTPCRIRHDLERWQKWRARLAEKGRQRELPAVSSTHASTGPEAEPSATGTSPPPTLLQVVNDQPPATQEPEDDVPEELLPPPPCRRCTLYKYVADKVATDTRRLIYALHFTGTQLVSYHDVTKKLSTGTILKETSQVSLMFDSLSDGGITSPHYQAAKDPHPRDPILARDLWVMVFNSEFSHIANDYELEQ